MGIASQIIKAIGGTSRLVKRGIKSPIGRALALPVAVTAGASIVTGSMLSGLMAGSSVAGARGIRRLGQTRFLSRSPALRAMTGRIPTFAGGTLGAVMANPMMLPVAMLGRGALRAARLGTQDIPRLLALPFRRNFGKSAAGIKHPFFASAMLGVFAGAGFRAAGGFDPRANTRGIYGGGTGVMTARSATSASFDSMNTMGLPLSIARRRARRIV